MNTLPRHEQSLVGQCFQYSVNITAGFGILALCAFWMIRENIRLKREEKQRCRR